MDVDSLLASVRAWTSDRAGALALAAFAGVVVFAFSVVVFPYHSTNHDEAVYLQQAALLLEGQVFMRPPVPEAFRPWFFVQDGDVLYSKYTPVTAAVFATGKALAGSYRVALGVVAAGNVALVVALAKAAFDRRTALLAGALLLVSPLFVVSSSVFLSYAPTTLFNLAFAYAYVRSVRVDAAGSAEDASASFGASRRGLAWAAVAGVAVGLAFFSRPYTAVLFATPFVAHAAYRVFAVRSRRALAANAVTGTLGIGFVALALSYNVLVTGDALTFPYQAFAPEDGLGFGTREILDYSREYTPALALRANAEVVARLLVRWVPLGIAGTLLAIWGARRAFDDDAFATNATTASAVDETADSGARGLSDRTLRALLLAIVPVVILGNVAFWGNLNVLGDLDVLGDGLVWTLGPYYHFDVLVPVAVFGAVGVRDVATRVRARVAATDGNRARAAAAVGVALALVVAAVGVGALAHPVAANYVTSQHIADAYDVEREYDDAVVFLPQIYGDWLNHPLQGYRNDPEFDGDAVYALDRDEENFAIVDAFPNRSYYRYTYRGEWLPFEGQSVEPRIQSVDVARGDRAGVDVSLGTPQWTVRGAVELTADDDTVAYYVNDTEDDVDVRLVVADGRARLVGSDVQARSGDGSVRVENADTVTVTAFLGGQGTAGLTYRVETPVQHGSGASAVMTPYVETCVEFGTCRGGAAYLPNESSPGVDVTVDVWATNASANGGSDADEDAAGTASTTDIADRARLLDGVARALAAAPADAVARAAAS